MQTQQITAKLTELKPGPFQRRQNFPLDSLLHLAKSVGEQGFINPPLVAKNGRGYHLIAGERRWRAKCASALVGLQVFPTLEAAVERVAASDGPTFIATQAALARVSVPVRLAVEASEEDMHLAAVVDNSERQDLNPIEEALEFKDLMERYGWSLSRTAQKVQKSDSYVRGRLAWLELDPQIQQLVAGGKLHKDARVAAALATVTDSATRIGLAQRFAERGTAIKSIEAACEKAVTQLQQQQAQVAAAAPKQPATAKAAVPRKVVPVANVVVVKRKRLKLAQIRPSRLCLPIEAKDVINNLAEELCDNCLRRGHNDATKNHILTKKCAGCEGVAEFLNYLMRLAND